MKIRNNLNLFLIALLISLSFSVTKAADLELVTLDTLVKSTSDEFEVFSMASLKNNTSKNMKVNVRNEVLQIAEGHLTSFCFGTDGKCFNPTRGNTVSDVFLAINAGATSNPSDFRSFVMPGDSSGETKVKYIFYDLANENTSASFITTFNIQPVSSIDKELSAKINIFPNPTADFMNIEGVEIGSNYKLFNSVGSLVRKGTLDNLQFNLTEFTSGSYVLIINGIISKEFIIQR